MTSCFQFLRKAGFVAGVIVGSAALAKAQPPASSRSPFVPDGAGATAGAPTENAPLEYRGMVSTKSGYMFALYDPSKHQSVWARLNEPGADFVVRTNDVNNDSITVDYQGRTLTLALKEAKVETMTAMAPVMAPPNQNGMRPPPNMNNPSNPAEEARRLEAVAAEVRRRRMLRAQANGSPQPQNLPPQPAH